MTNKKQLDESKLMTEIEKIVTKFKDGIESNGEEFGAEVTDIVNGLYNGVLQVIRDEIDDASMKINEAAGYLTYARIVWGEEAFDITFYLFEDTEVLGFVTVGRDHFVIQKTDICK